ncbi:hypothetical protein I3400192H8_09300 [Dialister sp. i34-0019-2H8]
MRQGNTDSIVIRFYSCIFMRCEEYSDANSELFKEEYDEALYENTCEIEFCDRISVSLGSYAISVGRQNEIFRKIILDGILLYPPSEGKI